jgi:hypothetical protein
VSRTQEAHAFARLSASRALALRAARVGGLRVLFGSLVLLVAAYPFLEQGILARATLLLLSTVIVVSGAYAVSATRRHLAFALLLAVPALVTGWTSVFADARPIRYASYAASVTFYVYTLLLVLDDVLRKDEIRTDELLGALSVYILIGLTWSSAYHLVEDAHPGSFRSSVGQLTPGDLTYYSYVTLMTVGSGEIIPVSATARSLTILEAMVGVVFVAVLIARLVGLHARGRR